MNNLDIKCKNCRYFNKGKYKEPNTFKCEDCAPHCRRNSPRYNTGASMGYENALFPRVDEDFYCGDFSFMEQAQSRRD